MTHTWFPISDKIKCYLVSKESDQGKDVNFELSARDCGNDGTIIKFNFGSTKTRKTIKKYHVHVSYIVKKDNVYIAFLAYYLKLINHQNLVNLKKVSVIRRN